MAHESLIKGTLFDLTSSAHDRNFHLEQIAMSRGHSLASGTQHTGPGVAAPYTLIGMLR